MEHGIRQVEARRFGCPSAVGRNGGKIVTRRAFGIEGPGLDVDFGTTEQIAVEVARGLTEGTLRQMFAQQAVRLGSQQPRPECGRLCARSPPNHAISSCWGNSTFRNPSATARPAVGTLSPQRSLLKLDGHGCSPAVHRKIVQADGLMKEFEAAAGALPDLAEAAVSAQDVARLTDHVELGGIADQGVSSPGQGDGAVLGPRGSGIVLST